MSRHLSTSLPRVLAVLPAIMPSTTIGVAKPLKRLHRERRLRVILTLESLVSRRRVAGADLIVFCRNTEPAVNHALEWAKELRKPIIYELDDDFFTIPVAVPGGVYHRRPERLNQLRDYLASASLIRVYSETMRQKLLTINPAVERVAGPLCWDLVPSRPVTRKDPGKVRIVYATSRVKDELENIFLGDMEQVLERFPQKVELFLWGYYSSKFAKHPSVSFLKYVSDYDRFFRQFARSGFDIGLAPLHDDDFHRSKSNNKFREYAACRIAGVYSDVPVYSECVQDGITGLLVKNRPGAWFDAIKQLVLDDGLRSLIQDKAQQYARTHYNEENSCNTWLEQIHRLLSPGFGLEGSKGIAMATIHNTELGTAAWRGAERLVDGAATFFMGLLRAMVLVGNIRNNGLRTSFNAFRLAAKDWLLLRRIR